MVLATTSSDASTCFAVRLKALPLPRPVSALLWAYSNTCCCEGSGAPLPVAIGFLLIASDVGGACMILLCPLDGQFASW